MREIRQREKLSEVGNIGPTSLVGLNGRSMGKCERRCKSFATGRAEAARVSVDPF